MGTASGSCHLAQVCGPEAYHVGIDAKDVILLALGFEEYFAAGLAWRCFSVPGESSSGSLQQC